MTTFLIKKNYTWVMSPRWFRQSTGEHLALDTGGGPIARLWVTALAQLVDDAVMNTPIFETNGPDKFKGIDIMRTVRSFDPCLPCGVHLYVGEGKVIEVRHSPTFGMQMASASAG